MYHKNQPNVGYVSMWVKYTIDEWCMGLAYAIPFIRTSISLTQLQPNNLPKVAPCIPGTTCRDIPSPTSLTPSSGSQRPQIRRFFFEKLDTKVYPWGNFRRKNQPFFRVFLLEGGWHFILEWFSEPKNKCTYITGLLLRKCEKCSLISQFIFVLSNIHLPTSNRDCPKHWGGDSSHLSL